MKKELIFCAPLRRQYYTDISKKNYNAYIKKGVSSTKFWGDIFEDMIYRDWLFGCYAENHSFEIGYYFSLEIDGEEVKGFQKYFKNIYKKSLSQTTTEELTKFSTIKNENDLTKESDIYGISMEIFHDRAEMRMKISKDFDINKFSISIEKAEALGTGEIIELYTPYYDGKEFDEIDLDDENRNDPIIFFNKRTEGLNIIDDY
jgi:hypothetical protein